MPTTLTKRGTTRAVADAARRRVVPTEGVVTAIVAVTGTEDSVKDIISPGSFVNTLRRLKPKFAWMHDWKIPLGRVLSVIELKPGDPRLPVKTPDGRPWPKEAGALIATLQFNLKTINGRDYYEHCKMWAESGEAAFSIGYKVVEGMASKRADGVRVIYALDLYEISLVLHGAHNMALALEVKNSPAGIPELEYKNTDGMMMVTPPAQPDHSDSAMVALYPDEATAGKIARKGGLTPDDLHVTVAYLGKGGVTDPAALAARIGAAVAAVGPLEGSVGGLGTFPPGEDGTPVWAPVDVPGLDRLRVAVTDALTDAGNPQQSEHGFTPHMTLGYDLPAGEPLPPVPVAFKEAFLVVGTDRYPIPLSQPMEAKALVAQLARDVGRDGLAAYLEAKSLEAKAGVPGVADTPSDHAAVERLRRSWSHGTMAAKIGWGTEGDFMRCVTLATEHMGPEDAKGWCNLRHHDALGIYPATHAKLEGKALPKKQKCEYCKSPATKRILHSEGMAYIPVCAGHLEKGETDAAASTPSGTPDPSNIVGIRDIETKNAPTHAQEVKHMAYMSGSYEERRQRVQDAVRELLCPPEKGDADGMGHGWVCIEAMFDDYVIASRSTDGPSDETVKIAYTLTADGVALSKPEPVELSLVAVPDDIDAPPLLEESPDVRLRFIDPAAAMLDDAARFIGALPEGKSIDALNHSILRLLDTIAVKGYDVAHAVMGDDEEVYPYDDEGDDYSSEDDAPDPEAEPEPELEDDEEEEPPAEDTVSLDPEAVRAQMAALRA